MRNRHKNAAIHSPGKFAAAIGGGSLNRINRRSNLVGFVNVGAYQRIPGYLVCNYSVNSHERNIFTPITRPLINACLVNIPSFFLVSVCIDKRINFNICSGVSSSWSFFSMSDIDRSTDWLIVVLLGFHYLLAYHIREAFVINNRRDRLARRFGQRLGAGLV